MEKWLDLDFTSKVLKFISLSLSQLSQRSLHRPTKGLKKSPLQRFLENWQALRHEYQNFDHKFLCSAPVNIGH
jgi:hypothetical protein